MCVCVCACACVLCFIFIKIFLLLVCSVLFCFVVVVCFVFLFFYQFISGSSRKLYALPHLRDVFRLVNVAVETNIFAKRVRVVQIRKPDYIT